MPKSVSRYFEFRGGNSSKFWKVNLKAESLTVTFGRIGTEGQCRTKAFATPKAALDATQKLIQQKLANGYLEVAKQARQASTAEPTRHGKRAISASTSTGPMLKAEFEKQLGRIVIQTEAQNSIIDTCKVAVNDFDEAHDYSQPAKPPRLLTGTLSSHSSMIMRWARHRLS